jgi:uncharacterized integral membrane protein
MMSVVRWLVGAALFLALLFLSLDNAEVVTLRFFRVATWQAPLVFVVFVTFVAGVAIACGARPRAKHLPPRRPTGPLPRRRRRPPTGNRPSASASVPSLPRTRSGPCRCRRNG